MLAKNADRKDYLAKVQAPSLIIGGTEDVFFDAEIYQETADLLPQGKAVIFENAGHMLAIEKLGAVRKVLWEFLAK